MLQIRDAVLGDLPAMLAIYNYAVKIWLRHLTWSHRP